MLQLVWCVFQKKKQPFLPLHSNIIFRLCTILLSKCAIANNCNFKNFTASEVHEHTYSTVCDSYRLLSAASIEIRCRNILSEITRSVFQDYIFHVLFASFCAAFIQNISCR